MDRERERRGGKRREKEEGRTEKAKGQEGRPEGKQFRHKRGKGLIIVSSISYSVRRKSVRSKLANERISK